MEQNQAAPVAPVTPVVPTAEVAKPKDKSKTPAILCTIFGILAFAGIGFGVYGMFFQPKPSCETPADTDYAANCTNPDNNSAPSNSGTSVITPLSVEETQTLLKEKYGLDKIENRPAFDEMVIFLDNFDQNAKIIRLYHTLRENLGEEKCSGNYGLDCSRTVSYEVLNNYYHQYYGSIDDLEKKDYALDGISRGGLIKLSYSSSDDAFTFNYKTGLGGWTDYRQLNKVISTTGNKEGFSAIVLAVTIDTAPKNDETFTVGTGQEQQYYINLKDEDKTKIYDSLKAYKFNFIKEDDGFKLTSIEKL
ncbi:hypothetical protein IKD57_01205 [Candidatus Saccharibacteria bacterium]|nr:hypothetical protein [Candidatus Saccharibacteria bacterium]